MLRSAASKVMWIGRATVFLVGLAVILALTVGVVSQASAQNNPNRPSQNVFMLGATNTVNAMSSLVGSVSDSAMLLVDNNGGAPALDLQVEPGQAPMKVNSGAKVESLNADKIDGKNSNEFMAGAAYAEGTQLQSTTGVHCGSGGYQFGAPLVTVPVTVPSSGLVAVYAEARLSNTASSSQAEITLNGPNDPLINCEPLMSSNSYDAQLVSTLPGSNAGTTAKGSWLVFQATPGEQVYNLYLNNHFGAPANRGVAHASQSTLLVFPL